MSNAPSSHFVSVKDCQIHYLLWDDANEQKNLEAFYLFMAGQHIPIGGAFGSLFLQNYKVAALDLSGMGDSGRRQGI